MFSSVILPFNLSRFSIYKVLLKNDVRLSIFCGYKCLLSFSLWFFTLAGTLLLLSFGLATNINQSSPIYAIRAIHQVFAHFSDLSWNIELTKNTPISHQSSDANDRCLLRRLYVPLFLMIETPEHYDKATLCVGCFIILVVAISNSGLSNCVRALIKTYSSLIIRVKHMRL